MKGVHCPGLGVIHDRPGEVHARPPRLGISRSDDLVRDPGLSEQARDPRGAVRPVIQSADHPKQANGGRDLDLAPQLERLARQPGVQRIAVAPSHDACAAVRAAPRMPRLELFVQCDGQATPRRRPGRGGAHEAATDDGHVDLFGHACPPIAHTCLLPCDVTSQTPTAIPSEHDV